MTQLTEEKLHAALHNLPQEAALAPEDILSLSLTGNKVTLILQSGAGASVMETQKKQIEKALKALDGVESVSVLFTAHQKAAARPAPQGLQKISLPQIKHILVVASGKGGVGKSTTSVNLAVALGKMGFKTGLLDADIYGPSIPRMLGLSGKPDIDSDKKMIPPHRDGLSVMSMGFLVPEDAPMVWRGPMVHAAILQLFRDVAWGALDFLIVDLPPGTGDAQLTLAQSIPLSGAVIVSTPQDIALLDARKAIAMFGKVGVPLLGLIENMSFFLCPHCGQQSDIFSHGGAEAEATRLQVPFLGSLPLDIRLREASDEGDPLGWHDPSHPIAQAYQRLAEKLAARIDAQTIPPKI